VYSSILQGEGGGSKVLWVVGILPQHLTVSQPRRHQLESSLLWKSHILLWLVWCRRNCWKDFVVSYAFGLNFICSSTIIVFGVIAGFVRVLNFSYVTGQKCLSQNLKWIKGIPFSLLNLFTIILVEDHTFCSYLYYYRNQRQISIRVARLGTSWMRRTCIGIRPTCSVLREGGKCILLK